MEYRQLGTSDLVISEISLGSWLTYGASVERERAAACVDRAFDLGINFFDTANVYGRGGAESFLGEVLSKRPRSSYYLATKVFFPMSRTDKGLSAAQIRKQSEASLKRLRTDYVDLYQCHRFDAHTPLEETMEALTELVRAGKTRYIGFSEWPPKQIHLAITMPGVEKFVSSQPEYSMLWRKSRAAGRDSQMMGRFRDNSVLEAVQRLRPIADGLGLTMAQLAVAWVLREPNVASAIVGASRPEQLDENAGASGVKLDDATLAAIDEALGDAVGP